MQNTSDQFHNQHAASQQQCQLEKIQLECGPMPNMMAALPNIGGTPCSMPQIWLTPTTRVSCRNTAQMRNRQQISAVSRPKFTILSGHVEEVSLFNKFFPIVDTYLSSKDIARQSCVMVPKWRFFASYISSEPRAAHFRHAF